MKTVCEINKCSGCMACIDICSRNAIEIEDSMNTYNAVINPLKCVNCNMCHRVCQNNTIPTLSKPKEWYQGWAKDKKIRERSSSGGFATAIAKGFVRTGGIVYSCTFDQGVFSFAAASKIDEVDKFTGSKYIKSNPSGVYNHVKSLLQNNNKVLFIGLPCQVAAVKNFIGSKLQSNLYTIDLICHGTPSPKVLDYYLSQYNKTTSDYSDIRFRSKSKFQVNDGYKGFVPYGVWDQYTIAFLNSLSYTDNCYECKYAKLDRVSDLTLGDSWGSKLDGSGGKLGISLALIQNEHGSELLELGDLHLESVDLDIAVANNHQLRHPSNSPKSRTMFFDGLMQNKNFNTLVFRSLPVCSFKQAVKAMLIKIRLYKPTSC